MQQQHLSYDELTPLEQCISDFMARQERKKITKEVKADKKVLNA